VVVVVRVHLRWLVVAVAVVVIVLRLEPTEPPIKDLRVVTHKMTLMAVVVVVVREVLVSTQVAQAEVQVERVLRHQ
jgi:hypothetical protein